MVLIFIIISSLSLPSLSDYTGYSCRNDMDCVYLNCHNGKCGNYNANCQIGGNYQCIDSYVCSVDKKCDTIQAVSGLNIGDMVRLKPKCDNNMLCIEERRNSNNIGITDNCNNKQTLWSIISISNDGMATFKNQKSGKYLCYDNQNNNNNLKSEKVENCATDNDKFDITLVDPKNNAFFRMRHEAKSSYCINMDCNEENEVVMVSCDDLSNQYNVEIEIVVDIDIDYQLWKLPILLLLSAAINIVAMILILRKDATKPNHEKYQIVDQSDTSDLTSSY